MDAAAAAEIDWRTHQSGSLYSAIRGDLTEYASFPMSWPYVDNAAQVTLAEAP